MDGFTCSMGTGGTLSGVGIALKERNRDVKIYLSDPMGSGFYNWYTHREWKPEGNSITEGIGNNHETGNIVGFAPDGQYQITDAEMLPVLFSLACGPAPDTRAAALDPDVLAIDCNTIGHRWFDQSSILHK